MEEEGNNESVKKSSRSQQEVMSLTLYKFDVSMTHHVLLDWINWIHLIKCAALPGTQGGAFKRLFLKVTWRSNMTKSTEKVHVKELRESARKGERS